ncbi:MAG: 6-bladed beta-propeller [Prevotellaceae bacterium]|jgi:hypothetical protein|nr:6-bladed beta-propeller [Prevotellaceae bacterium]
MKQIKFALAFALLLSISCSHGTTKHNLIPIYIEPDKVMEAYDIAGDVETEWDIVPLETTDDCLISQISRVIFQNEMYYILDNTSMIYLFNSSGKYLRKLDRKGQGPGEYLSIFSFDVIGNEVWVSDVNRRRLLIYDSLFNFIGEVNNLNIAICDMNHAGQNVYVASNWFESQPKNCQLARYSIPNKQITSLLDVGTLEKNFYAVNKIKQIVKHGDSCLFFQSCCDTLFQIRDNTLIPKYKFSFSERYQDIPRTMKQIKDDDIDMIRGIQNIEKTRNSIIFNYADRSVIVSAVYSELTGKSQVYSQFRHSDLGNLLILPPRFTPDGEMICKYEPMMFFEGYKHLLDETKFKNPADLQKLKTAIATLKEDDNPVLIKFKLKKDSKL